MRKIGRNEKCPCGSGKKYKQCCFHKDYDFFENSDGEIVKSIPINEPIVHDILNKQENRFKDIFGRERLNGEPIFLDGLMLSEDDYKEKVVELLSSINVRPQIVYAFEKLGYCILEGQQGKYTDKELDDWDKAVQEYWSLNEDEYTKEMPSLFSNLEKIESSLEKTKLTYALLVHKYNKRLQNGEIAEDDILSSYCYFILSKNLKSTKAIELLIQNNFGEDAINLIRSVYENYLQLLMAIYCPNQLEDELNAKIGLLNDEFERGKSNFNILVNKKSKIEVRLLTGIKRAMLNPITKIEDEAIYTYLYNFMSSFTHPDIQTIGQYINEEGFTHVERNLQIETRLYLCFINTLLMSELIESKFIEEISMQDINNFIADIKPTLNEVFNDISNENPKYPTIFLTRLDKIGTYR